MKAPWLLVPEWLKWAVISYLVNISQFHPFSVLYYIINKEQKTEKSQKPHFGSIIIKYCDKSKKDKRTLT